MKITTRQLKSIIRSVIAEAEEDLGRPMGASRGGSAESAVSDFAEAVKNLSSAERAAALAAYEEAVSSGSSVPEAVDAALQSVEA